jgi:hypothetical protein
VGSFGRGVLLDLKRSSEDHDDDYDPASDRAFSAEELLRVAESQGVTFESGEFLVLRDRMGRAFEGSAADHPVRLGARCWGLEPSDRSAEFPVDLIAAGRLRPHEHSRHSHCARPQRSYAPHRRLATT